MIRPFEPTSWYNADDLNRIEQQIERIAAELTRRGERLSVTYFSMSNEEMVSLENNPFQKMLSNIRAIGTVQHKYTDTTIDEWIPRISMGQCPTATQLNKWIDYINYYSEEIGI